MLLGTFLNIINTDDEWTKEYDLSDLFKVAETYSSLSDGEKITFKLLECLVNFMESDGLAHDDDEKINFFLAMKEAYNKRHIWDESDFIDLVEHGNIRYSLDFQTYEKLGKDIVGDVHEDIRKHIDFEGVGKDQDYFYETSFGIGVFFDII